jgi:D-serine deaminase-like pyridoxal phosphate-dependent protein
MHTNEIPTPALVVDVQAMQRNIERAATYYAERQCKLRPHFKAHKTPEIAKRQLAAGSCTGITVATVGEAEVLAQARLCDEILIANQILGPGKAARAAAVARKCALIVAIDSDETLDDLAREAKAAHTQIGVLIDVNVGLPRCGVAPGEPAVRLAERADETGSIVLRGAMGYEGHVMAIRDRGEREAKAHKAMDRLLTTVRMMREEHLRTDIVSAGGTCTYDITGAIEGITEVQAGTYALMDNSYLYDDLPFELAFTIHTTVLSRPRPEQCATDAGLKAMASDHGMPGIEVDGASVLFLSDEHCTITLPPESAIRPGDRIKLLPPHIDPTINMHDVLYAVEGDDVVGIWPVAARGYIEQRSAVLS